MEPSNLITFVKNVPEFWKPIMKSWIGDPIEDEEKLQKISPLTYVENIKADILIAHGANNPRVVASESHQIRNKLQEMGNYVEYIEYPDEGHGFLKEENRLDFRKKMLNFVSKRFFEEELDLNSDEF